MDRAVSDPAVGLLLALGGAIVAAHGARMSWRQVRAGTADGRFQYPRSARPVAFAAIVLVNASAMLLGAFFLTIGLILVMGAAR
jgi:hypothetical protein